MKWLLIVTAVFLFLPHAHACTVTVTPATTTLQTNQTQNLTASLSGTGCGSTTTWSIVSCSASCGTLTNKTRTTATYNAPTTAPSGAVTLTVTATNGSTCSSCAAFTIKVPTGLTITPANSSIYLGTTQTMSATENFSDGSNTPNVSASYTSSKTNVATVSGSTVTSANFSALLGSTTITGSYTDPQTSSAVTGTTSLSVTPAVQINALGMPSGAASGDVSDFQSTVLGNAYVWGVNPTMVWNAVESSSGTVSGGYDFTSFDATLVGSSTSIFPSGPPTKMINIIVTPVTGGCAISTTGNPNCGNSATPSYVLGNIPTPLTCFSYPGNGGSGSANGGFPEVFNTNFQTPYENFIAAVLKHYSNSCDSTVKPCNNTDGPGGANGPALAPYIGYIRFGLSAGGEVYPFCAGGSTYSVDSGSDQWIDYVNSIDSSILSSEETYQSAQQTLGANIQMMTSINQNHSPTDFTVADDEADYAYNHSSFSSPVATMGFGSQGLQKSDVSNYASAPTCTTTPVYCPCTSDWCTKFNQYTGDLPLELQTVLQSDPTGSSQTGSLATSGSVTGLIPFATSRHATILELYPYDLLYAFDSNYCNLAGKTSSLCPLNNTLVSDYVSAIEAAVSGN
jgi:hypothetical protein